MVSTANNLDIVLISETYTANKVSKRFFCLPYSSSGRYSTCSSAIIIKNIIKHYVMAEYRTKQIKLRGRELKINIDDCGLEYLRERHIRQRIKIKS